MECEKVEFFSFWQRERPWRKEISRSWKSDRRMKTNKTEWNMKRKWMEIGWWQSCVNLCLPVKDQRVVSAMIDLMGFCTCRAGQIKSISNWRKLDLFVNFICLDFRYARHKRIEMSERKKKQDFISRFVVVVRQNDKKMSSAKWRKVTNKFRCAHHITKSFVLCRDKEEKVYLFKRMRQHMTILYYFFRHSIVHFVYLFPWLLFDSLWLQSQCT